MSDATISPVDPYPRQRVKVDDTEMAYVDTGSGAPIVFLHGNPTSSYLWRNVIPHLAGMGRCLAPDLIGMGDSGSAPDGSYRFVDHARYLDAWFAALDLGDDVTLVVHDWGSALGFDWANRNRAAVKGIAYMEAIVTPLRWDDWPESATNIFRSLRSPSGEEIVLQKNTFVERILPASVIRKLSESEMGHYRRPFLASGESRRPMLTWPRQIPLAGEPADVVAIVNDYAGWLNNSIVPKLFINADPGMILTGRQRELCRTWRNQREITVKGLHFIQEDSPYEIGTAIANWYGEMRRKLSKTESAEKNSGDRAMSVLTVEVRNNVAHLTLNRPEAANALNLEMAQALEEASLKCEEDPNVRAVLLTGAGKLFCGGGDLKSFAAQSTAELPGHLKKVTMYLHTAIQRFARMKAPLVIAVNGNAGGAGLSLALIGDITLAGESTRFTVAYTRIGLTPDGSSSYYLPRMVGLKRAMELMLTNRTLTAREAEAIGMITRVVPDAELLSHAESLANELAQGPTQAFGGVKRLLYASPNNPLHEQMEIETAVIADLSRTADAREGMAAFLGKRAAKYSGR